MITKISAQYSTMTVIDGNVCVNIVYLIRRIWRLDNRTHNALINLINGYLPVNLMLGKNNVLNLYGTFLIVDTSYISLLLNNPFTMEDLLLQKIFDI